MEKTLLKEVDGPLTVNEPLIDANSLQENQNRSWASRTFGKLGAGSIRGTIFILMAAAMGPSVLAIPSAFFKSGIIAAILLLILGAVLTLLA